MLKVTLIMILSALIILGLFDLFRSIKSLIFKSKNDCFSAVIPVKGNLPDIEFTIKRLLNTLDISNCKTSLIIVDLGMDFETLEVCYALSQQNSKIIICTTKELAYFTCDAFFPEVRFHPET